MIYYMDKLKISGWDIETSDIRTDHHLRQIKVGLQKRFPRLMANIIKILLYRNETSLACYLTAHYELALDKNFII